MIIEIIRRSSWRISALFSRIGMWAERKRNPYFPSPNKEHRDWLAGGLSQAQNLACAEKYK